MDNAGHRVRVIGTVAVGGTAGGGTGGGGTGGVELARAQSQFLAALVAFGPAGAGAEQLADCLWFGELPGQWRASLRMRATRLRRVAGEGVVSTARYRLALAAPEVDVWHLMELADIGPPPTEHEVCWALAGEPYPGVELAGPLLQALNDARRAQRRLALAFCAVRSSALSDRVTGRLEWLVSSDPIDAELAAAVGRCLHRAGRRAEALRLLHRFTAAHIDYLRVEPPTELARLLERIAADAPDC